MFSRFIFSQQSLALHNTQKFTSYRCYDAGGRDSFRTNSGQFDAIFVIYMLFYFWFMISCPFFDEILSHCIMSRLRVFVRLKVQALGMSWMHAHMELEQYSSVPLVLTIQINLDNYLGPVVFMKRARNQDLRSWF